MRECRLTSSSSKVNEDSASAAYGKSVGIADQWRDCKASESPLPGGDPVTTL